MTKKWKNLLENRAEARIYAIVSQELPTFFYRILLDSLCARNVTRFERKG